MPTHAQGKLEHRSQPAEGGRYQPMTHTEGDRRKQQHGGRRGGRLFAVPAPGAKYAGARRRRQRVSAARPARLPPTQVRAHRAQPQPPHNTIRVPPASAATRQLLVRRCLSQPSKSNISDFDDPTASAPLSTCLGTQFHAHESQQSRTPKIFCTHALSLTLSRYKCSY